MVDLTRKPSRNIREGFFIFKDQIQIFWIQKNKRVKNLKQDLKHKKLIRRVIFKPIFFEMYYQIKIWLKKGSLFEK